MLRRDSVYLGTFCALMGAGGILATDSRAGSDRFSDALPSHLRGPGVANHPVGVVPSARVRLPEDWPLGPGGTISCQTCHVSIPMDRSTSDPLLRQIPGRSSDTRTFCATCHTSSTPNDGRSMHWLGVRRAHLTSESDNLARFSGAIDLESKHCLACHDGVNAGDRSVSTGHSGGAIRFGDASVDHPVGMSYPPRMTFPSGSSYRPAAALPDSVRLPGGMVSCVSCHDLYGTGRKLLTVTTAGSALCFTCHDM